MQRLVAFKHFFMKNLFFIISILSSVSSFGQLPPEFPKEIINKVFCYEVRTCGILYGGKVDCSYMNIFKAKIYISEDEGIYVEYNYGEKWGKNNEGTTHKISKFPVFTKKVTDITDKYDDVIGKRTSHEYKVYNDEKSNHFIHSITFDKIEGRDYFGRENWFDLTIKINVPNHEKGIIFINPKQVNEAICNQIKSKAEIAKEEAEKKRIEQERMKLENQKKELDKISVQKINDLLSKNSLEDAAKEFGKLNFVNPEIKGALQQKLNDRFGGEVVQLNLYNIEDYIKTNKLKINTINPENYSINFDKNGNPSNNSFPIWIDVPKKEFGSFSVYLNSQAEFKIILKDSILVSSTYSTSNEKALFIDKNENFYFKTKTGLPVATISNDPSIDKKLVRINKVYKREKYANGILIDSQEFKTEKTVGIMKKDQ